jgi:hypothetical protein
VGFRDYCGRGTAYVFYPAGLGVCHRRQPVRTELRHFQEYTYLADLDLLYHRDNVGREKKQSGLKERKQLCLKLTPQKEKRNTTKTFR